MLWQCPKCGTIELEETAAPRSDLLRERPIVVAFQLDAQSGVELADTEVGLMAQRRHDPAFDSLYRDLDLGLVAGLSYPSGQDRDAVVLGEVLIAWVQIRLIPAGTAHAALEVICNSYDLI